MSKRSSLRHVTLLAFLVSPTFLAARCDNALSIGEQVEENENGEAGAPADVAVEECSTADCGTPPKSATYQCNDGSLAGPECARDAAGKCGWTVRSCPAEPPSYACADGSLVHRSAICNGKKECPDGSDEADCGSSGGGVFECATPAPDGTEIIFPNELHCNGKKECPDGSDEVSCGGSSTVLLCADGSNTVVALELACNGKEECPDGSDEAGCDAPTSSAHVCSDAANLLLPRVLVCNGKPECPSGSDETNCTPDSPTCPSGVERASSYDAENACLGPAVPIGCYELISPELTVPTDPRSHCARRRSDGAIFWVGSPKHIAEWEDCSAEEASTVDSALSCAE